MVDKPSDKRAKPQRSELSESSAKGEDAPRKRDVMLVHGVSEKGDAYHVLRAREDRLEAGVVRPVKEGAPLEGEVVKLTPRPEGPLLYDVDVQVPGGCINAPGSRARTSGERTGRTKGPAQVASDPYRANWDRIWNKRGGNNSLPN